MTQRLDKLKTDKVRGPNSKLVTNGPETQKMKINTVAQTKFGVYKCHIMIDFCLCQMSFNCVL